MRKLLLINDTLANKISFYHLLLLLVSLPFDYYYSHVIVISFAVHTLIHFKKSEVKPMITLRTFMLQSVFLVTLIATTYSNYKNQAFNDLGRQIVIFIFPILFCLNPLDIKKYRQQLLLVFALYCTGTVAYLYANVLHVIRYYHYPVSTVFSQAFTNHNFSNPIGMHATFFSLQVAIALMCLLVVICRPGAIKAKVFYGFCSLVLLAGLVQLSSKSVVGVVFVAVSFVLPFVMFTGRQRILFISGSVIVSLLALVVLLQSATFKERYINSFSNDLTGKNRLTTVDSRIERWGAAMQLIRRSPLIGYGSGSEIALLQDAFFKNKLYDSYLNKLNSHNQYLNFWLKSGIWGLVIYLLTLGYGFTLAFKTKDVVFITFMLLIVVVSISEVIFDMDKGTMFYGLLYPFLVFSVQKVTAPKRVFAATNILMHGQPQY